MMESKGEMGILEEKVDKNVRIAITMFGLFMGFITGSAFSYIIPANLAFIPVLKKSTREYMAESIGAGMTKRLGYSFLTGHFATLAGLTANHINSFYQNPDSLSSQIPLYTNAASLLIPAAGYMYFKLKRIVN